MSHLSAAEFDAAPPVVKWEYCMEKRLTPSKLVFPATKSRPEKITWTFRIGERKEHSYTFLSAGSKQELVEKFCNYAKNVWGNE